MCERCTTYSDRSSHLTISNRSRQFELLDSFEYSDRIDYSYLRTEYSTVEMVTGFQGHPEVGKVGTWNTLSEDYFFSNSGSEYILLIIDIIYLTVIIVSDMKISSNVCYKKTLSNDEFWAILRICFNNYVNSGNTLQN